MNCDRAETLLPLLRSGDLKKKETEELARHLNECETCRESARDYELLFSWIRSTDKPSFDDQLFSTIRTNVLKEIGQKQNSRRLLALQLWPSNAIPALALTLLLVFASVTALVLFTEWLQHNTDVAMNSGEQSTPGHLNTQQLDRTHDVTKSAQKEQPIAALPPTKNVRTRPVRKIVNVNTTQAARAVRDMRSKGLGEDRFDIQDEQTAAILPAESSPMIQSGTASRIEFQTADPNIRIIWLARNTN